MGLRLSVLTSVVVLAAGLTLPSPVPAQPPAAGAGQASVLVVSLRSAVTVADPHVCLGDVASILGGDASLRRHLAQLDLADLSATNAVARITRQQVDFRIRLDGVEPARFQIDGAAQVEAHLAVGTVAGEDVLAAARRLVLQRLPWRPEELLLRLVGPVRSFQTLAGQHEPVRLEAELRTGALPLGRVRVDVTAYVDGQRRETVPVNLDVLLLQRVALAGRRIERGEVLTEDKLRFDQRAVDRLDNYIASADSILGKRARIALGPGQLITATEVEAAVANNPVIIHARDVVHLVAHVGPLRVTATGEALQDGRAGQMIRVRNIDSNHTVLGRVRDRDTVEVSF